MDRKRRLMENNNGWPLRNQLFDGAPIALPLTHTVIGRGGLTPSFTRATTETGQKWDEAGYLDFTALAGEMVFKGARRERNLLATSSKDFSVTTGISLNATPTAGSVVFTNASAYRYKRSLAIPGTKVQCSCLVKSSDGSKAVVGVRGYGVASGASAVESVALTTEYQQITITISGATTNEAIDFGLENRIGIGGDGTAIGTVEITQIQINDITGETDQTTIRPYVSVGVESAPAYHGSMVDGVKCYDTDRSGNPISTSGSYPLVGYVPWEARTNLCLQSQTLGTTWAADASTSVTADQYVAPDGTTTMDKVTSLAGTSQHYLKQGITFSAGVTTYSFYLRYVNNQWCALVMSNGGGLLAASFDLLNGVVGALGAGTTSTIQATAIADVYRVSITGTMSAGAGYLFISPNSTDTASLQNYTAAGTETVGAWGAQVELGSFATPYIPTTTVAVARNKNELTYTGMGSSAVAAGWCYAEISTGWNSAPPSNYVAVGFGNSIEGIIVGGITGAPTEIRAYDGTNSVTNTGNASMYQSPRKTCMTWGGSTMSISQSGDIVSGSFDGAMGSTTLGIGNSGAGSAQWNGGVRNVRIGYRKLSASELQAITA